MAVPTTPFAPARRASEKIPDCEFLAYEVDHFDVYLGDAYERTVGDQLRFLDRHFGRDHSPRQRSTREAS